nr:hypothetical protein [Deltaproteobacteria bacterium]
MDPWTIERTETELDEAWRSFHSTDLEFRKGLSNHGPMAAEALVALGHPQRVAEFVARYRARLEPLPSGAPIPAPARHAAVGDLSRRADWIATYHAMIDEEGPQRVARREIPALASGVMAGALHALIRTGHALRALHRRDTPTRRCELAHALGYWAARHQPLPGRLGVRPRPGQDLLASLAAVPTVPTKGGRLIFERVEAVRSSTAFIEAVETADLSATTLDAPVTALVEASAELYLSSPRGRFVYLHGIPGSSAQRLIAPWL